MLEIAKNLNLKCVEIFRESRSAKQPGRPVFNEMLARIHAGEADGIICWKINRLARNPVDGGQISWMLQQGIIQHIQTFGRDYRPTDNVIMMAVELGMANQFVNDLSVDVKRGARNKAERGWYPQSHLPFGYKHNTGYKAGEPEVLPTDDLVLVKKLFKAMLSGEYSVKDIQRLGSRLGIKNKKGKPKCYNFYLNMLTSEFYSGSFYWNGTDGKPLRHKGKHPAIITEADYKRVQLLLGKRGKPTRVNSYDFAFRGPLSCGECGCSITVDYQSQCICTHCKHKFSMKRVKECPKCNTEIEEMAKPTFVEKRYYRCTKKSREIKCTQGAVEEAVLEKMIRDEINKIAIDSDFYNWAKLALKDIHRDEIAEQKMIASRVQKRAQELRSRVDQLVVMRADGEISSDQFRRMTDETERALFDAETEERALNQRTVDWAKTADGYLTFTSRVQQVFNTADNHAKREILQTLGLNLHITNKKLVVTLCKPLLGIQNVFNETSRELGRFEPKKALEKQGLSQQKHTAFETLCAGLDSNQRRLSQRIYSPPPLTAWVPTHSSNVAIRQYANDAV